MKGCKPEISCGNSLTNPCDVNAQCFVERDGSVSCQVKIYHLSQRVTHEYTVHKLPEHLSAFICLVSVGLAGPVTDTCAGKTLTLMDIQMRSSDARI